MPTKPSVLTTFTIATNLNYAGGPFLGSLTKVAPPTADGYTPGTIIDAEHHNFVGNSAGQWITNWLFLGTSAADEDAHLVETDATGLTNLAAAVFGGTTAAFTSIVATENSGAGGSVATLTNSGNGFALLGTSASLAATIRGICLDRGAGVEGQNVGGDGPGVIGSGDGTGEGVGGTGGATGHGGLFVGGATSGHGVKGTPVGASAGVFGESSATTTGSQGVFGNAARNDTVGILGTQLIAGADPTSESAAAITGLATAATGVYGKSTDGYGVWAQSDTTGPTRAAMHVEPQDAAPGTALDGDVYFGSADTSLHVRTASVWNILHNTLKGYVHRLGAAVSGNTTSGTLASAASLVVGAPNGAKVAGIVQLEVTLSARNITATLNTLELEFFDLTSTVSIETTEVLLDVTNALVTNGTPGVRPNAFEKTITFRSSYTLPNTSSRTFQIRLAKHGVAGGGAGVEYENLRFTIDGMF